MNRTISALWIVCLFAASDAPGQAGGSMSHVRDWTTSISSTSVPGSYAYDGITGAFEWDLDGDQVPELLAFDSDRLLVQRQTGAPVAWIDGAGSELWKRRKPLFVRIGANRYIALKSGANCAPSYCARREVQAVSLFADAALGYTEGQIVAQQPFAGGGGDDSVFAVLTAGLAVCLPGQTLLVAAVSRNICHVRTYELAVATNGAVSLTALNQRPCPSSQTIAGNGASLYEIRDTFGQNPEPFLFATDIIRLSDLSTQASWVNTNGTSVPNRQGTTYVLNFGYTVSNHIDSSVVVDRGTPTSPDYWVYALFENGILFVARLAKSPGGTLSFTPQFGTQVGNHQISTWGPGAESVGVGRVRGLSASERVISLGRYIFDLDGNILADMNAQVTDPDRRRYILHPYFWYTTPQGALVRDHNYGFEVDLPNGLLRQSVPETKSAQKPYSGPVLYHLWEYEANLGWSHPPSFKQGFPHATNVTFDIDAAGNVRERLLLMRTQRALSIVKAQNEQVLIAGPLTQLQRDQLFSHAQSASWMRASDSIHLEQAIGY